MNTTVNTSGNTGKQFRFRQRTVHAQQLVVQTRSNLKMHSSLVSEKTGFHID